MLLVQGQMEYQNGGSHYAEFWQFFHLVPYEESWIILNDILSIVDVVRSS